MNDIFTGIFNFFTDTPHHSFYTAIGGRLAYVRADSAWSDDYAVMRGVSIDPDDTFDAEIDDVDLQFSLFSSDRSTCGDIHQKCRELFHGAKITIPNHQQGQLLRGHSSPLMLTPGGLWMCVIEFNTKIQRV